MNVSRRVCMLCSVMGIVLTSTCVLCAGALALHPHPPGPVTRGHQEPPESSYLHLPVFVHSRKPRVDKRHFAPTHVKSRSSLPARVHKVLVPESRKRTKSRARASGPTSVACSATEMRVRVHTASLEAGMRVRLGTCNVSNRTEQSVLFRYALRACGTQRQMLNETLVYSNMLHYTPDPSALGSEPFSVPVQCRFNRFHYSYKIGYVPSVERLKFLKPIKTKGSVSLTVCDDQWNRLSSSQAVIIGRPMHFEAQALYVPEDQRLFLSSCHVTTNSSRFSPQVNIIENYGCLIDSKRSSGSRFISSTRRNVVRFIIDAFRLQGEEQKHLFLHCEMAIRNLVPTETAKLCSFNQLERRWEELNGADAVCSCCDSSCVPEIPTMIRPLISDLTSLVEQHSEEQKSRKDPAQNPDRIFTQALKHELALRENLLRTDIPAGTLASEHGTVTSKGLPTMPESDGRQITPETLPTPETPLVLDSNHDSLTLKHESRSLTPEKKHTKMMQETPPMLEREYGTPVPDTERGKFAPCTRTTLTPSVQQTTVTPVNTHTVPREPYRIFEEVFGLS